MVKLIIEVEDEERLVDATEHVLALIRDGYTSGRDSALYWDIHKD